jgi:hypothetical protein
MERSDGHQFYSSQSVYPAKRIMWKERRAHCNPGGQYRGSTVAALSGEGGVGND